MAGPATIGSLRVDLGLNSAQFSTGLKNSKAEAKGFAGAVKSAMGEVRSSIEGAAGNAGLLGTALGGAGLAGVAAAAALAAAFGEAKKAMAFGDALGDSAAKLAVTTDALQEYRFAVHALGGEYADADTALAGFSKAFGAAHAQLTARAGKPFEALGLDATKFESTEEALQAVIRRISELKSTAEQAAIADKLGLTPMLPALRAGADKINELRQAAQDLGYVMDADLIEKAGEANDKFEDLQSVMDVQFKSTMVELAPTVLSVAEALNDAAQAAGGLMGMLQDLNTWSASNDLGAMFRWSNDAGAALGAKLGTDQFGKLGPAMWKAMGGGKPAPAATPKPAPPPVPTVPAPDRELIPPAPKAPKSGGGKGVSAAQQAAGSEQAIASAMRAELSARIALTKDVAAVASLREQEVRAEVENANRRLQKDAAEGRISKAAADTAIALNNRAALEKTALIRREAEVALQSQAISHQEASVRVANQIAQIEASLAATAAERNGFEAAALERQQSVERIRLQADLNRDLAEGEITEAYRATAIAAQRELQAAERRAAEQEARVRFEAEATARAEAGLQLEMDLLASQGAAATTSYERHEIALELLKLEQQLERLKLEEIVATTKAGSVEHDRAKARLESLEAIHANQTEAAIGVGLMADAFADAAGSVDDVISAFRKHDWNGVVTGLAQSIKGLQAAFGEGGTIGGKIGAVAGIASMVGSAIGGTAGSALSGAASGAMAGFSLGGPVGAAIGGIIGGIGGFLGGSSAKKKAKREAAEKARLAEEDRKAKVAQQKRSLELTLMEAQGKTAEVLAARRSDELAVMDASNRALQEQVWAAQDAADIANQTRALEISLMEAQGDAAGALAARRAEELAAMDGALRPMQEAIYAAQDLGTATSEAARLVEDARNNVARAYERRAGELAGEIDKFKGIAASLRAARESLSVEGKSDLGYELLSARLEQTGKLARLGNEEAMGSLAGVIEQFLPVSKESAATLNDYLIDVARANAALEAAEGTANRTASIAEQQLSALDASVAGLLAINDNVESVDASIAALARALGGYSSVTGQKLGLNPSSNAALAAATGYKGDFGAGGWQAWILQQDDATKAAARQILTAFGQPERIVGFKTGGGFEVGGSGGADSQLMQFKATPGEMINIRRPGQIDDAAAEVRRLSTAILPTLVALATTSNAMAIEQARWKRDGLYVRGSEPGAAVAVDAA